MSIFRLLRRTMSGVLVALCASIAPSSFANVGAALVVQNGVLLGAKDVNVNGSLYDVSFVDGTCASLFAGCSGFAFTTEATALAASQALLDQVLLDQFPFGPFDTVTNLTFGCQGAFSFQCAIHTPYAKSTSGVILQSVAANSDFTDYAVITGGGDFNSTPTQFEVWAKWSAKVVPSAPSPVPEPESLSLLGIGLAALALASRRRKHMQA